MFRSSYKEVHVSLADLNDHSPVFDKEEYEIRVPESALVNTPLTRLKVRAASVIIISVARLRDVYPGSEFFRPGSRTQGRKDPRSPNPDPQQRIKYI
jgi:hypothetical protein